MAVYLDGWRRWRDFSGRSGRLEYLVWKLPHWGVFITLLLVGFAGRQTWALIVFIAYSAVSAVPSAALAIRRVHDTGRSAGYARNGLRGWPPIVYALRAGQAGSNQFGPPPEYA